MKGLLDYFSYPKDNIGFHSGWTDENDQPTQKLSLSRRKQVLLSDYPYETIGKEDDKNLPGFMVKDRDGKTKGLSCGAGSALVKHDGEVFKIKRAGYKEEGFIKGKFADRSIETDSDLSESNYLQDGGAYQLEDAQREIELSKVLESRGFLVPQKPVGLNKIQMPFSSEDDNCALIFHVQSDFRLDELVIATIACILEEDLEEGKMLFNHDPPGFSCAGSSLIRNIDILYSKYFSFVKGIGNSIGSLYSSLHRKGFIRGIGNSWYGNEIVCYDGRIGLCDLEATYHASEIRDSRAFRHLQNNDLNLASTAIFSSLNSFECNFFDVVADILIEGMREGYVKKGPIAVEVSQLQDIIGRFREMDCIHRTSRS